MRRNRLLPLAALLLLTLGAGPTPAPAVPRSEPLLFLAATRDIAAGETLTSDELAAIQVPKEWVTSSLVKADLRKSLVGSRLSVPLLRGDLMMWHVLGFFDPYAQVMCARSTDQPPKAVEQVARARHVILEADESLSLEE